MNDDRLLFLDTANFDDIDKFLGTGAIRGVTTNPSLVAKEEKKCAYSDMIKNLIVLVNDKGMRVGRKFHLSVEVIETSADKMLEQALSFDEVSRTHQCVDLFVKIPVTFDNLNLISRLTRKNVDINATCCMTALQAKMAQDAGAGIVSFFYNRIKDGGSDPNYVLQDFADIRNKEVKVICGSIRKPDDVFRAWTNGSDIVTASTKVIRDMLQHDQTDRAIKQFEEDITKWQS
jgi:transaldolase